MKSSLDIIAEAARQLDGRLLLVGGHALQAYGVVRQTMDVDVLVSHDDMPSLATALATAGHHPTAQTDIFTRFRGLSIYQADIDAMGVDPETFARLASSAGRLTIGANRFAVPALSHLVALKLHAVHNDPRRELRDLADIVALMQANTGAVSDSDLQDLCYRYGPEGIWERLRASLGL
jgi:hypothetical protein